MRLQITAGGVPDAGRMAALAAAALTAASRGVPADQRPAAYHSRWRRAGLLESAAASRGITDNGTPWGGHG
jgi:hypothetical protein